MDANNFLSIIFELTGHGHPTEVSQHMVTKTEFEIHPGESLIFDNISALLDAPGAQGRSFNIKKGCKPRLISQSLERENTGPPYFSS